VGWARVLDLGWGRRPKLHGMQVLAVGRRRNPCLNLSMLAGTRAVARWLLQVVADYTRVNAVQWLGCPGHG
jgi:hypothetical protein